MTDETKGDGMTLEHVLDEMRAVENTSDIRGVTFDKWRNVIDDHLASQSAMRNDCYGYASRVAIAIWKKHYSGTAPSWELCPDLMGVLTQIDNMTCGLTNDQSAMRVDKAMVERAMDAARSVNRGLLTVAGMRAALQAAIGGQHQVVLDAPARVGAVTFGMGVAWSSVIGCAQRAYNAKPLPRETVEALKRMLSEIQSDAEQAVYGTTGKPQP